MLTEKPTELRFQPVEIEQGIHQQVKLLAAARGKRMHTVATELIAIGLAVEEQNGKGAAK